MIPSDSQISLFSTKTGASDLSIFEQHLPQEKRRFRVDLQNPRSKIRPVSFRNHGSYDFTVEPWARSPRTRSPHSREGSPTGQACPEDEFQDDHFAMHTQKVFFRSQRLSHFNAGRQFPALVSPRFLPSYKREVQRRRSMEEEDEEEYITLPKLPPASKEKKVVKMTVSAVRHKSQAKPRRPNASKHNILPFIPGGNRRKSIPQRTQVQLSGGFHDDYDAAREALKEEFRMNKSKMLSGAFLPSCAKPKRKTLGPLSFCRSQFSRTTPLPFGVRSMAGTAQEEFAPEADTQNTGEDEAEEEMGNIEDIPQNAQRQISAESRMRTSSSSLEDPTAMAPASSSVRSSASGSIPILGRQPSKLESEQPPAEAATSEFLLSHEPEEDTLHFQAKKLDEVERREKEKIAAATAQFWKSADEGKVHHDDVPKALANLGFVNPQQEWIDEAFNNVSKYVTIGLDDFLRFVKGYEACQRAFYKQEFEACDDDGSGSVESGELFNLMKKLGILPMQHVLEEVIKEVDDNGNGELDFGEFEAVMDILRRREGFAKEEYDEIAALFSRFDRDQSGSMDTKEVIIALKWLGFHLKDEEMDRLIIEIDEDGSGQIDEAEWFVCMRKVREKKIAKLQQVMAESDADNDGTIQFSELQSLIRSLGYVPDFDAVFEAAAAAGIREDDDDLDIGELWRLLVVYREREGLNEEDLSQVEKAFDKYAKGEGDDTEVESVEVGKLVRAIGYVVDFELQQLLTSQVDIDSSGRLDRREFRKMVRMIHEKDVDLFRMAFNDAALAYRTPMLGIRSRLSKKAEEKEKRKTAAGFCDVAAIAHAHCNKSTFVETVPVRKALLGLQRVSCTDSWDVLESFFSKEAREDGRIDFYEFCQAAIRSRRKAREAFRKNGGFTEDEITELREVFNKYDSDAGGQLSGQESIQLFQCEFPSIAEDPSRRRQMVEIIQEADEDGSGTLDFGDFLRIVRQLRDIQDQLLVSKENAAVKATKFTQPEVQEFRELFLSAGDGLKELGFPEIKELLKCIVPMGTKNTEDLQRKFDEQCASEQVGDDAGDDEGLDFPEFLFFMRSLIDIDFAGMSGRAAAVVERENKRNSMMMGHAATIS